MRTHAHVILCTCIACDHKHMYVLFIFGPNVCMQKHVNCMCAKCRCTIAYRMHVNLRQYSLLTFRMHAECKQDNAYILQAKCTHAHCIHDTRMQFYVNCMLYSIFNRFTISHIFVEYI